MGPELEDGAHGHGPVGPVGLSDRLRRALAVSPDVVLVVDAMGCFVDVGPSLEAGFGHRPEDLLGRSCFELVHPDDVLLAVEGLTDTLATQGRPSEHIRLRVLDADGAERAVEVVVNNQLDDPVVAGIVLTLRDRSGDEEVERNVREREDRYRQIAELALEGVWYVDLDHRTTFVTHRLAALVGRTVADVIGCGLADLIHPDDLAAAESLLDGEPGEPDERTVRVRHSSGRSVWVRMTATPLHAPDGTHVGSIALVADVTEQRLAQERLAATEAREAALLDALPDMLFRVDASGTVVELRSGRDGPAVDEAILGRRIRDLLPPSVADRARRAVDAALRTGHVAGFAYDLPVGDEIRNFEARLSSVGGTEVVALVRDVTEIHEAERSRQEYRLEVQRREAAEELAELERGLAQAARLEALGRLAGGIAHDMNNLLGVIGNYAATVLHSTAEADTREDVAEIERTVRRGTQLTQRLLLFGRQGDATTEVQDLVGVTSELGSMLARTIGPEHELRLDLADPPEWVSVDRSQIEQAVVNLVLNAKDAAPSGTAIVVSVSHTGDTVSLSVADGGPGMSAEVLERAFEPFFTTKPPGSGTGLGLAVVHGVAVEAGGAVRIDCPAHGGTVVTLDLPRHDGPGSAGDPATGTVDVVRSTARILVVDDDEASRRSMHRMLESEGFTVQVVGSAERALDVLAGPSSVDVVLADVSMPGMRGTELVERLRTERPGLPVVLLTGYPSEQLGDVADDVEVLTKPLAVGRLMALLAGLGERAGTGSARELDQAQA